MTQHLLPVIPAVSSLFILGFWLLLRAVPLRRYASPGGSAFGKLSPSRFFASYLPNVALPLSLIDPMPAHRVATSLPPGTPKGCYITHCNFWHEYTYLNAVGVLPGTGWRGPGGVDGAAGRLAARRVVCRL